MLVPGTLTSYGHRADIDPWEAAGADTDSMMTEELSQERRDLPGLVSLC